VEGHPQAEVRSDAGLRDLGIGKYAHFRGERIRRAFRVGDEPQGAQRVVVRSACRDGREVRGMPSSRPGGAQADIARPLPDRGCGAGGAELAAAPAGKGRRSACWQAGPAWAAVTRAPPAL
jgi:hypothetical protein